VPVIPFKAMEDILIATRDREIVRAYRGPYVGSMFLAKANSIRTALLSDLLKSPQEKAIVEQPLSNANARHYELEAAKLCDIRRCQSSPVGIALVIFY
jgi:hypothetical protein